MRKRNRLLAAAIAVSLLVGCSSSGQIKIDPTGSYFDAEPAEITNAFDNFMGDYTVVDGPTAIHFDSTDGTKSLEFYLTSDGYIRGVRLTYSDDELRQLFNTGNSQWKDYLKKNAINPYNDLIGRLFGAKALGEKAAKEILNRDSYSRLDYYDVDNGKGLWVTDAIITGNQGGFVSFTSDVYVDE